MAVVVMCRLLQLVVAMGMVVVFVVSASNSEPTLLVHPDLHQSAIIHRSADGKESSIREAELDLTRPAPKVSYPPPPGNIGLQQDLVVSSDTLMGVVLKRYEEIVEALLAHRFHLRGIDNLVNSPKSKFRPASKGYPPSPKSPLAANNKARPAPRGYPPAPKTPLADGYPEQYNQAKVNGLERM